MEHYDDDMPQDTPRDTATAAATQVEQRALTALDTSLQQLSTAVTVPRWGVGGRLDQVNAASTAVTAAAFALSVLRGQPVLTPRT